jgi:RNA polymerase sigma-70 factor (ECF subfamily)
MNHKRSLWRRMTRELESRRWFERAPDESPLERSAMRCLAGLPAAQREAVVLKIWHEHTFEEIGALLEISPNTVAARYRYALEKLRTCLKGEVYEQPERNGERIAALDSAASIGGA